MLNMNVSENKHYLWKSKCTKGIIVRAVPPCKPVVARLWEGLVSQRVKFIQLVLSRSHVKVT
jgi:hypothetical protein